MSHSTKPPPLSVRLAESVVFLRGSTEAAHSRRRHVTADASPAMLRGLLTLHLTKPTRISSIEILFEGKSAIHWPEGTAHRRVDIPEEHNILSARTVFFDAKSCPESNRSASLGPGTRGFDDDIDPYDDPQRTPPFSARSPPSHASFDSSSLHPTLNGAPPLPVLRRNSADTYRWPPESVPTDTTRNLSPDPLLLTPPVSPPYTPTPAVHELPVISRPSTPIESSHHRTRSIRTEENPGQMLEEFRNALRMEMGSIRPVVSRTPSGSNSVPPTPETATESSASSQISLTTSPRSESAPGSRSTSRDVEHRHPRPASISVQRPPAHRGRTASPSPSPSPSTPPALLRALRHLPTNSSPEQEQDQSRGRRSSSRWSLSNMSHVLKDAKDMLRNVSKEPESQRGRTPERRRSSDHHVDFVITSDDGERKHREKERKSALSKLTAAIHLDEPSHVENWKEFRKGTYTYPISFAIPATSPPTVHCDFGAVIYRLKAVVHRPGALTAKLVATREVTLIASPADDDTEETHSIVVERQWDTQLRYLIALSGRSFVIGSQVPFNLTMVPMEKCKIYRLSVFLEEKTEYYAHQRQMTREQPVKRFELLSIKHIAKNPPPILPINPDHAALLMPYLDTTSLSTTVDEALSSLMGPGPWALNHDLQLPAECGKIHFTYKHKGASISVSHTLKIVFRVERGDDLCLDPKTGKRRMFDIVVQTPIHILSCHCKPEWTSLPRYSLFEPEASDHPLGPAGPTCACGAVPAPALASFSPAGTPANSRPTTATGGPAPPFGLVESPTSALAAPPAHLASSSFQFARLMSGQEGILGDAPPRYQEVLVHGP